eukprot:9486506-Pyramimonas_sp.AAC.1
MLTWPRGTPAASAMAITKLVRKAVSKFGSFVIRLYSTPRNRMSDSITMSSTVAGVIVGAEVVGE